MSNYFIYWPISTETPQLSFALYIISYDWQSRREQMLRGPAGNKYANKDETRFSLIVYSTLFWSYYCIVPN